jgi:hypothetical protein
MADVAARGKTARRFQIAHHPAVFPKSVKFDLLMTRFFLYVTAWGNQKIFKSLSS